MYLTGKAIPDPQFPVLLAPILSFVFFIFAFGEELSWQEYLFEFIEAVG